MTRSTSVGIRAGNFPHVGVSLAEAGAVTFLDVPRALWGSLGELHSVASGIKPSCRVTLLPDHGAGAALDYIRSLGLSVSVAEKPPPVAGSWGSLPGDIESTEPAKIRLYIARTAADSRALLCAESVDGDYVAFGRALGYPACCIEAAVQADGMVLDPKSGRLRQRSLTAVSARASRGADFRCNHFLLESPIDASGPVSPVSHYPCRLDCADSAAFGGEVLAMAQKLWPLWHSQWLRLLRSPMIYWPDDEWPFEFRDEYAGLALVHANLDEGPSATWHSATHALPLGRGQTPMGALPTSVVRGCIVPSGVLLESPDSSTLLPHASLGKPLILDWERGQVRAAADADQGQD